MSKEIKQKLLCFEASRWRGITERGGDNKGQVVELFQAIIGGAVQEAWCVSFIQYCLRQVDDLYDQCGLGIQPRSMMPRTESVVMLWKMTPLGSRCEPFPGCIVLWEHYKNGRKTGLGHAGLVIRVENQAQRMTTIEGNTSPASKIIQREGDGVYQKERPIGDVGDMRLLGFLKPW